MSKPNDGGLAFPAKRWESIKRVDGETQRVEATYPGLSVRDWFAGQVFGGMAANSKLAEAINRDKREDDAIYRSMADHAYRIADALLAARGDTQEATNE